jgi:hypothetical protein
VATQTIEIRVLDKTAKALSSISDRLQGLNSGLLGINRIAGLAVGALGAIGGGNVIRNIISTTSKFQDLRIALNSVTGSAQAGGEAMGFIKDFAATSIFEVDSLTKSFIQLKAAGIDPTRKLLTTFQDVASVTTDRMGALQSMTDLFSRTTGGGLGLIELERLATRGIDVFGILEQQMGLTRLQVADFGKTAEGAAKIKDALLKGLDERFGGAAAASMKSLSGTFSNLQDNIANVLDTLGGQGFLQVLTDVTAEISSFLSKNEQLAIELGEKLTKAALFAVDAFELVRANIGFIGKAFIAFFGLKIALAVGSMAAAFGSTLVKGLVLAARAVKALPLAAAANPLIAAGLLIAAGIEATTGAFSKLAEKMNLGGVADEALDALAGGFQSVGEAIGLDIKAIDEFYAKMGDLDERAAAAGTKYKENLEAQGKTNVVLTEQEKKQQQIERALERRAISVDTYLGKLEREIELNGMNAEAKEYETELDKRKNDLAKALGVKVEELATAEVKLLETKVQGLIATQRQLEMQKKIDSAAGDLFNKTKFYAQEELRLMEQGFTRALEIELEKYEKGELNFADYQDRKLEIEKTYQDEISRLNKENLDKQDSDYMASLQKRIAASQGAIATELDEKDKEFLKRKGQEERLAQQVKKRTDFEKKSELEKTQFGLEQGANFFQGLASYNKKFFAAYKAFSIAQAIVNTYVGATNALKSYPPPFNFIAAAATVAAGLAQVSTIRAQTAQRGGTLIGGQPAVVGEDGAELIVPKQGSTVIPREVAEAVNNLGGGRQDVTVNFNISTVDAAGFDQLLIERRGTIVGLINQAVERRGRQGVV